jgi:hypothetical protein
MGIKFTKPLNMPSGNLQSPTEIDPRHLSQELNSRILKLYGLFLASDGTTLDYDGLSKSPEFSEFRQRAQLLAFVDLHKLTEAERMAFFINLYNIIVIHGIVECGPPRNSLKRMSFFQHTGYLVGRHFYSLNDIEHGILRGNKKNYGSLSPQLSRGDPRLDFVIRHVDPRIHFALTCGARSCPPIRVFSAENLEKGLQQAALNFCQNNIEIDLSKRKITLSRIFQWYLSDFGSTQKDVLLYIEQFLTPEQQRQLREVMSKNYTVAYDTYDWSLNAITDNEKKKKEILETLTRQMRMNWTEFNQTFSVPVEENDPKMSVSVYVDETLQWSSSSSLSSSFSNSRPLATFESFVQSLLIALTAALKEDDKKSLILTEFPKYFSPLSLSTVTPVTTAATTATATTETSSSLDTALTTHSSSTRHHSAKSENLQKFLREVLKESKVTSLLGACLHPAIPHLVETIIRTQIFSELHWRETEFHSNAIDNVKVVIRDEKIEVVHCKHEQIGVEHSGKEPQFQFEWEFTLQFDSEVKNLEGVNLRLTNGRINSHLSKDDTKFLDLIVATWK